MGLKRSCGIAYGWLLGIGSYHLIVSLLAVCVIKVYLGFETVGKRILQGS